MDSLLDKEIITDDDIRKLLSIKAEKTIHLDFKQAESLGSNNKRKMEITKNASSFANSTRGIIVNGIKEINHVADSLSSIDGDVYTKEWIEQYFQQSVRVHTRKLDGTSLSRTISRIFSTTFQPFRHTTGHDEQPSQAL